MQGALSGSTLKAVNKKEACTTIEADQSPLTKPETNQQISLCRWEKTSNSGRWLLPRTLCRAVGSDGAPCTSLYTTCKWRGNKEYITVFIIPLPLTVTLCSKIL